MATILLVLKLEIVMLVPSPKLSSTFLFTVHNSRLPWFLEKKSVKLLMNETWW